MLLRLLPFLALIAVSLPAAPAGAAVVDAGALVASDQGSAIVLRQPGAPGATLRLTGTAPAAVTTRMRRAGEGMVRISMVAPEGTERMSARFARARGERFLGFGERSDAVLRTRGTVEHRVTEGPYQPEEDYIGNVVPAPGYSERADATYFPIPWLLSTRGYGVLVEDDATSRHRLGSPWSVEIEGRRLTLLVVAGPGPKDALRRFSAHVGRQPAVMAAALGPWWQVRDGGALTDEQVLGRLRRAGAIGSVVQTSTHYLPCADHVARREAERERVARFSAAGLVNVTYFNPMICTSHPRFAEADARGWLTRGPDGASAVFPYTAAARFEVGQLDLTAPGATGFFAELAQEALDDGHLGWMEDFGEYTPDDAVRADGLTGSAHHNAYARDYHAGVHEATGGAPLLRYVRSGWTGSARFSPIVWGGDPTVGWGFDGLESAVRNGLSMGLSGVSRWGSDIGGFFALSQPQTSPELLRRWIQVGFASGIMRTQGNGFDLGEELAGRRSEITDPEVLPVWARYAQLRTRLLPVLLGAERAYDRSGMPVMRHLALAYPGDRRAVARDDQWLLGEDLLVAPVLRPGQDTRRAYLPRGRWVDLWRSADADLTTLRRPRTLRGGRDVTLSAPGDELPLLVRHGAVLELLPTGGPTWRAAVEAGAARRSVLAFGAPRVRLSAPRARRFAVQWQLPRRPEALLLGSRRVPFSYRDGVLRTTVTARRGTLRPAWTRPR